MRRSFHAAAAVLTTLALLALPALAQTEGALEDPPEDSAGTTTTETTPDDPPPISAPEQGPTAAPPPPPPTSARKKPAPTTDVDPEEPAVRAKSGNMGLFFRFGGLASLTHGGDSTSVGKGAYVFSQLGGKWVLSENLMIPVWFGMGVDLTAPAEADSQTDFGIELGGGIEYHFRIWRRISPFFGGAIGISFTDPYNTDPPPKTETKWSLMVELIPSIGIEYYIADRVSLTAMYMFIIGVGMNDTEDRSITKFNMTTQAGGALNITYYF